MIDVTDTDEFWAGAAELVESLDSFTLTATEAELAWRPARSLPIGLSNNPECDHPAEEEEFDAAQLFAIAAEDAHLDGYGEDDYDAFGYDTIDEFNDPGYFWNED